MTLFDRTSFQSCALYELQILLEGDPNRTARGRAGRGVRGRLPCTVASEAVLVCLAPLASLTLPSSTLLRSELLSDPIRVQVVDTAPEEAPESTMDATVAESVDGGVVEVRAAAAAPRIRRVWRGSPRRHLLFLPLRQ